MRFDSVTNLFLKQTFYVHFGKVVACVRYFVLESLLTPLVLKANATPWNV